MYWYGAVLQLELVNTDMNSTDQSAYMDYARNLYESNYAYIGGRNRMPVYPFLQSLFYRPDMTEEAFFIRGKFVNLVLSLGLLAGLAFIFRQFFSWFHSLNLLLIVAFTVFIFKAGYFQTELLFYFVNFCLFLLMWRLLQRMSWQLAILTGIVAGLAHLTKASILPGLIIFLVLAVVKWGWTVNRNRRSSDDQIPVKDILKPLLAILLVVVFFLITVYPYIRTSKRVFGHYFYNVNSTFYIWYDSWEEVKQGTRAHGDRVGWPDMAPEELPSMSRYLREHSLRQIINRFIDGAQTVLNNVIHSYGYFKYIVIYMCVLMAAILLSWQQARRAVMSNPFLCLFLALYFGGYLLLYFWYAAINSGNRLILAQFIPLMFTLSYGIVTLLRNSRLTTRRFSVDTLVIFNLGILFIVVMDIYFVLTEQVGTMYGGL
jgi:hypothetical protein